MTARGPRVLVVDDQPLAGLGLFAATGDGKRVRVRVCPSSSRTTSRSSPNASRRFAGASGGSAAFRTEPLFPRPWIFF